ncbi:MAG: HEAT repeat domain-containing protein [Methanomicrobiales archaeon]|nr:HEAT repeat domain-containing protein [Methanomicrobiales archaeon]
MRWPIRNKPNIPLLLEQRDISGLIRALRHPDTTVQWQAAEALGNLGRGGLDHLLRSLKHRDREVRLGVIEALGEIRDPGSVPALLEICTDPSVEVRWATAIALGEIGDKRAIERLIPMLGDSDKYVRYGAAIALEKLGWEPADERERTMLLLGKQEWEGLARLGEHAIRALSRAMKDRHADVRIKAMEVLGDIGSPKGIYLVVRGLRDENPSVRWKAVLAGPKCGIHLMYLPRGLNKRPWIRKNPRIAAFLNFILPGQGYNYLGLWFGTLIFQVDVTLTLYMLSFGGEQLTYMVMLPIYALFALHAWFIAQKMPEL